MFNILWGISPRRVRPAAMAVPLVLVYTAYLLGLWFTATYLCRRHPNLWHLSYGRFCTVTKFALTLSLTDPTDFNFKRRKLTCYVPSAIGKSLAAPDSRRLDGGRPGYRSAGAGCWVSWHSPRFWSIAAGKNTNCIQPLRRIRAASVIWSVSR